jgi:hypothetical protein
MLQKIDGVQYNTRELQRANFDKIQVKGNTLWGEPKKTIEQKRTVLKETIQRAKNPYYPKENFEQSASPATFADTSVISNEPYYNKTLVGTGLQLTGTANDEQKKIAEKYSSFFKSPISIKVVPNEDSMSYMTAEKKKTPRIGQVVYNANDNRPIELSQNIPARQFEYAMLHEIAHQVFHYDEKSAIDYAYRMMEVVNNFK